ncbi:MAG: metal-dependent hydrolase [Bacteroidetes bacterium]|nr:metal-dependent hydrolase [Bacteroidota bacterium]
MSKIIYHGHSFVEIRHNDSVIYIDPFITHNPLCDIKPDQGKCDYIILTHGHGDHFGDTVELASDKKVKVIAMFEISEYLQKKEINSHPMSIGGAFEFPFGKVKLTIARHSSSLPDGTYAGEPAGIILNLGDKTVFHAGDTALFYDMKLIGEMNSIDVAFLPVGDNFTMGIDDAVKASEFLNAKIVVPIHYNTFDVIEINVDDFKRKIESIGRICRVMAPGDSLEL